LQLELVGAVLRYLAAVVPHLPVLTGGTIDAIDEVPLRHSLLHGTV
jgi:hypothetical protein